MRPNYSRKRLGLSMGLSMGLGLGVLGLVGCPSDNTSGTDMGDMAAAGPFLKGPSKSSTIAISDDDATVAVVNQENSSVSFFSTANNMKLSTVQTGSTPSAVVIAPDKTTAYVANRADSTIVRVTGINTGSPSVGAAVAVGSEPTGLALSPSGAKLFVAEFGENHVSVIDTATMTRSDFAANVRSPRAIAVTNNGDASDGDETVIVPEFYGVPQTDGEGKNDGRRGTIRLFSASNGSDQGTIQLAPFANTDNTFEPTASPNQLYAVGVAGTRIYVPSVSAAPAAPLASNKNVYPIVYVGDLATKQQLLGGSGTVNLAEQVNALPTTSPRFFLAEMTDIAFVPTTSIGYLVARGADVVQRVDFNASPPSIGSPQNKQIDVQGSGASACQNPTGIVVAGSLQKAFVNCWVSRRLAVLDLTSQTVATVVDSVTPSGTSSAVDRGRRFYFTGRGRWSGNGNAATDATENGSAWSSCGTCHPDGLSDNITWIFGSGPRQSTSMDGSFSHGPGAQKQRIFNATAIFDEVHDFDNNTRGVSGGKGAITTSATCGMLGTEVRSTLSSAGLGSPVTKELQDTQANNCVKDFDDINEWVKTIKPPKGRRFLDQASVTRGAALFAGGQAGCAKCHGGAGWTVSNRFYTPSAANNGGTGLPVTAFTAPTQFTAFASPNGFQISAQNMSVDTSVAAAIPPLQLSCALRKVGTFGVPGDTARTDALEIRNNTFAVGAGTSNRAQGLGGYNPPSLYGLQVGAPYLHHGQAKTLEELFTDTKWQTHWQAGNPNFLTGASAAQDRADIINFLLSIDSSTAEQSVPAGFSGGCACPGGAATC